MTATRFALAALASCLAMSASAATESRAVAAFHAIGAAVDMDMDVIQDGRESLVLEGDADVLAVIETFVRDGTLELRYKRDAKVRNPKRVHATVHVRNIDAIALSGSANVRSRALKGDTMTLSISGSGDVEVADLTTRKASLSIGGSGNVRLAGHADDLTLRISGSGEVMAGRLETQRAEVNIAGSGRATVWSKQQLATAISGAGTVRYYGDPSVAKAIRGVGHVERIAANP